MALRPTFKNVHDRITTVEATIPTVNYTRDGVISLLRDPSLLTTSGSWSLAQNSSSLSGHWLTNGAGGVDGNYFELPNTCFYCEGGTYSFWLAASTLVNAPKVDLVVGGTTVTTSPVDLYTAGTAQSLLLLRSGVSLTAGYKTVKLLVNGKNASSTGYIVRAQAITWRRTGA